MADSFSEDIIEDAPSANASADVEMTEGAKPTAAGEGAAAATEGGNGGSELPFAEGVPDDTPAPRITFLQYLTSPMVTLLIGSGETETILTAHQGLLMQSPFFADRCAEFTDDGSVRLSECISQSEGSSI